MKTIITIVLLAFTVLASLAQKPKQHIYYDTVKTVKERVDYEPDTIAVWFKQIEIDTFKSKTNYLDGKFYQNDTVYMNSSLKEFWQQGYLIWHTYKKLPSSRLNIGGYVLFSQSDYYKDEYPFTKSVSGVFLYADRKTVCKNIVVYCIKR